MFLTICDFCSLHIPDLNFLILNYLQRKLYISKLLINRLLTDFNVNAIFLVREFFITVTLILHLLYSLYQIIDTSQFFTEKISKLATE